jgi:periplasmic mercuric ion binding protein
MRKTLIAFLLALPVTALAGTLQTAVLDVQKMTCALCSITVQKALEKVPGVVEAKIDYDKKTATVKFDPEKASPAALVKAATEAGFPATPHSPKP